MQYTDDDIKILQEKVVFNGFYPVKEITFQQKLFNGTISEPIKRELVLHKKSVVILAYNPELDSVILVEQFRIGAYKNSSHSPWLYELIAGMIDANEDAEDAVQREAMEEAGISFTEIQHIFDILDSPGGSNEKLYFYLGITHDAPNGIYGVAQEDENIKVHTMPLDEAYQLLTAGKISNGAAVIGLQWLMLHRNTLPKHSS